MNIDIWRSDIFSSYLVFGMSWKLIICHYSNVLQIHVKKTLLWTFCSWIWFIFYDIKFKQSILTITGGVAEEESYRRSIWGPGQGTRAVTRIPSIIICFLRFQCPLEEKVLSSGDLPVRLQEVGYTIRRPSSSTAYSWKYPSSTTTVRSFVIGDSLLLLGCHNVT